MTVGWDYIDCDMNVDLTKDVVALRRLRLERDLPYRALADAIGMTTRNLHRLLTERPMANERTAFRVRAYLKRAGRARAKSAA